MAGVGWRPQIVTAYISCPVLSLDLIRNADPRYSSTGAPVRADSYMAMMTSSGFLPSC